MPLPRVLIIGDSISLGYTPIVQHILHGRVEISHHEGNAQDTRFGLEHLDAWIGQESWDCIHCNWGLWDVVGGEIGPCSVPLPEYRENLEKIRDRLKRTGAKLIWALTTPVPKINFRKRLESDILAYNAAASEIMRRHGVMINDLHAVAQARIAVLQRPNDVHFTHYGSAVLAQSVAAAIAKTLAISLPPVQKSSDQAVILCLGDSNGAGWVPALEPLVTTEVVGCHRSGMTIGFDNLGTPDLNMLASIEAFLAEKITVPGKPVREILILLGTNDCKAVFADRQGEVIPNLDRLTAYLRRYPWPGGSLPSITLLTPTPYGSSGADDTQAFDGKYAGAAKRVLALLPQIRALGEQINAPVVDLHTPLISQIEALTTDGIHFTPEGYAEVVSLIAKGLDADLRKT